MEREIKELTPELVIKFTEFMCDKHRLKIRDKRKSRFMKIVAWFMGKFSKISESRFLNEFTTTLFKRIWVCFRIGNSLEKPLENQIGIFGHECQHDFQRNLLYPLRYVFSRFWRAMYEREAYATSMELAFWYTGKILDPLWIAKKLLKYGCDEENVDDARIYLEMRADRIKQGIVDTKAGKQAISFLEVHAPLLKRKGEARYGKYL